MSSRGVTHCSRETGSALASPVEIVHDALPLPESAGVLCDNGSRTAEVFPALGAHVVCSIAKLYCNL